MQKKDCGNYFYGAANIIKLLLILCRVFTERLETLLVTPAMLNNYYLRNRKTNNKLYFKYKEKNMQTNVNNKKLGKRYGKK